MRLRGGTTQEKLLLNPPLLLWSISEFLIVICYTILGCGWLFVITVVVVVVVLVLVVVVVGWLWSCLWSWLWLWLVGSMQW